jgi:hypothetical protein
MGYDNLPELRGQRRQAPQLRPFLSIYCDLRIPTHPDLIREEVWQASCDKRLAWVASRLHGGSLDKSRVSKAEIREELLISS